MSWIIKQDRLIAVFPCISTGMNPFFTTNAQFIKTYNATVFCFKGPSLHSSYMFRSPWTIFKERIPEPYYSYYLLKVIS
jgi:hypothetical protein